MGPISGLAQDRFQREFAAHRRLACITVPAVLFGCVLLVADMHQQDALSSAGISIASVTYASFAAIMIMRWPLCFLIAVTTVGAVASMAVGKPDFLTFPGLVVGTFLFSLRSERAPAITCTAFAVGVMLAGHLAFSLDMKTGWSDLAVVPWIVVAGAMGQAVRAKRAHEAMLEERARRAEEGREYEARRRVQQERLRIARELHDAVGHHVALISVQAGAMGYLLDNDLGKARESLAHIRHASEAALEELRLTVGLLRQPGEREPVEPAGGLDRLDELIGSFTATGLRVSCAVTGEIRPLPEAVDLTAYRVIQESLTNTAKHAAGASASVRLAFRPEMLTLLVEDDGPYTGQLADSGEGHGIIGMRERAVAVGGWLSTGPRGGGGFRVLAELPAPGPAAL